MSSNEYSGIMIFAEQKNKQIHKVSYELLGKGIQLASKLKCDISCVILGPKDIEVDELIYRGANKVYHITDDIAFNYPDEQIYSKNITNLVSKVKPEIILFGATTFGRSLAPRVAAILRTGLTADCTELEIDDDGKLIQIRPAFSENILAHIKSECYPQMATVRYKEFDEAKRDTDRRGEIVTIEANEVKNEFVEIIEEISKKDINLADSKVIVAAGAAFKTSEDLSIIKELAALLGGEVGASRDLVETGAISKDHQVGYSGNRVKPLIYFACGISGAPQHIAGMKESDFIIAINDDPSAPIFNISDYSIVGDVYKIIPQLIEKIKSKNV